MVPSIPIFSYISYILFEIHIFSKNSYIFLIIVDVLRFLLTRRYKIIFEVEMIVVWCGSHHIIVRLGKSAHLLICINVSQ